MKKPFRTTFVWILLWTAMTAGWAAAQNATITKDAVLQRDAGGRSKTIDHIESGERVVLVEPSPQSGYYHIRTEDDEIGWVSVKFVKVSDSPNAAAPSSIPPSAESACDATLWDHVYYSQRLMVRQGCTSVTGILVAATNGKQTDGVRHEADGETHGWLQVDPGIQ
jgi:uncharacterized protein YgiM (DUF1202 family)